MTHSTRRVVTVLTTGLMTCLALSGCAFEGDSPDGESDVGVFPGGKADGTDYTLCELDAVVSYLNEGVSFDELRAAGVHSRASRNLVVARDGADATYGTADDASFTTIQEVDAVSWVGPVAIRQLVETISSRCAVRGDADESVVFSPQRYDESHLASIRTLIDASERSIDIAMYSFRDAAIMDALEDAVGRGVLIRMMFNSANDHRRDPDGTVSAQLEDLGIEVRYVNKIMHHKFAIIDGARTDFRYATDGILVSGSGNWSNGAATRFDENTMVIRGNGELNLRYQREFNLLWDNGRPFTWNEDIVDVPDLDIADSDIPDDPTVDAVFTSANFRTWISPRYGPTFSVIRGENTVSDVWVRLILGAERSIRIASGHLRSRPIYDALVQAQAANPDLDVRVYLDGQEYISATTYRYQERDLEDCVEAAGTSTTRAADCYDRGFLFGYATGEAGIAVRYKYYAYRWAYEYADQMHHKYMVIDEDILVTGSYNLSYNAEHNTMENITIFRGASHQELIDGYVDNFDELWVTGEEDGLFETFIEEVRTATRDFPIVFPAMALEHAQVTELKRAIRDACPVINTSEYRTNAARYRYCDL